VLNIVQHLRCDFKRGDAIAKTTLSTRRRRAQECDGDLECEPPLNLPR
jgi:hypothetical protein